MRIHHVGVAVADLDAAIQLYTDLFGAELTHRASNEADGLAAAFLRAGDAEVETVDSAHVAMGDGDIECAVVEGAIGGAVAAGRDTLH